MDTNLVLRDGTTTLTTTETLTSVVIGPMVHPLWLHVLVPAATGTLDVSLEFCAAAAPTTKISSLLMKQITAIGYYSVPFYTQHENLQVKLTTASSPNFGAVKVWIAPEHRGKGPYNA
jgi:hypothetical protein